MKRRDFNQMMFSSAGHLRGSVDSNQPVAPFSPEENNENSISHIDQTVNIADVRLLAQRNMEKSSFDYVDTGSCDEYTLRDNIQAFQRIKVLPPLLTGVSRCDLSTVAMGETLSMPILLAPVAAQRMFHQEGGPAAVRAASTMKTLYAMSSSVGSSVEEIAQAAPCPKWFQLYVPKDRNVTRQLIERVNKSGFKAIVLTVDLGEWKDADHRNKFTLPKSMLVKHLRDIGFHHITNSMSQQDIQAFNEDAWDLNLSWDFIPWLRKHTHLPLLIKGVLRPQDARQAVHYGADGIIVSNHGGRRLDGMPSSIDSLPGIVEAVENDVEIYLDSGIRRGTDILKALALGARAVLIGRPYAWGLGAAGENGVRKVLQLLRDELINAMVATGCPSVHQINRSLLQRS